MDAERARRYADKLAHAEDRLHRFQQWVDDAADDLKDRLASYKAFQEATEAMLDVAAMILKDMGTAPKDDYTNVGLLVESGAVSEDAASALREANGLRNRLVHEYGGLADDVALRSGRRLAPALESAIKEVRTWISKQT